MPAAMVKYAINNHPDSVGMEGVHQLFKIIIYSKAWVNVKIIQQIIFMIFACCKYRINVDGIDAKVFQVMPLRQPPSFPLTTFPSKAASVGLPLIYVFPVAKLSGKML